MNWYNSIIIKTHQILTFAFCVRKSSSFFSCFIMFHYSIVRDLNRRCLSRMVYILGKRSNFSKVPENTTDWYIELSVTKHNRRLVSKWYDTRTHLIQYKNTPIETPWSKSWIEWYFSVMFTYRSHVIIVLVHMNYSSGRILVTDAGLPHRCHSYDPGLCVLWQWWLWQGGHETSHTEKFPLHVFFIVYYIADWCHSRYNKLFYWETTPKICKCTLVVM